MVNGELKQLRDLVSSAICRLYHGDGKTFCWQGTAYAIGTHTFLTAYHVVEGVKPEQVYLGSPLFDPRQRIYESDAKGFCRRQDQKMPKMRKTEADQRFPRPKYKDR
jgi:hypothetical protein